MLNIFICVCGEPEEIIKDTILSALRARDYYKKVVNPNFIPQIVVLNDGKAAGKSNWLVIKEIAESLGVIHIARDVSFGFKAGNINNGLLETPTNDPFNTLDIVLDSDFAAKESMLVDIVKPFSDSSIDFAQSPQEYKNEHSWVAKASAAHQLFFFEHITSSKGHDNALFLCGTNFAIRREALDSIGGMDTRFITEDYATSLELHLTGRKGVFIPKVLAQGIAPSTLKAYFNQQQRWSKGSFDVTFAYLRRIIFGPLTARQKFHYLLSASYYLIGLRDLILMLAPLPYLLFGVSLIKANSMEYLLFVYLPFLVYNFILYALLFRHPIKSMVLDIASFPVFTFSFLSSLLKRDLSFIVTIKKYEKENPFKVYKIQLFVITVLSLGISYGLKNHVTSGGSMLNYFWAGFDVIFLTLGFYMIARENYNFHSLERYIFKFKSGFDLVFSPVTTIIPRTAIFILISISTLGLLLSRMPTHNALANIAAISNLISLAPEQELLVPDHGVYYGYYQPNLNTHPTNFIMGLNNEEKTTLAMFYQDWGKDNSFDTSFMNRISSAGRIPVLTWEPWDSSLGKDGAGQYTPAQITGGKYDDYIRNWAKSAAIYRRPFYLRFAHEMNGNWYPWGNKNDSQEYINMWKHVHNIFDEESATNVIWVWSPNNTDEFGSTDSILSYYPGDNYVDWVGFSGFNWGTSSKASKWTSFKDLSKEVYAKLSIINKPIMVSETSSASLGGDKAKWFNDLMNKDIPSMKKVKAVIFFDSSFNNVDFRISSDKDVSEVIKENISKNSFFLPDPIFK